MAATFDVQIRSVPADRAATDAVPLSRVVLQHHRTDGIQIDAQPLSGGHLLHLAVAGCIFNDLYLLAADRGIRLTDVRVSATGGFEGRSRPSPRESPTRCLSRRGLRGATPSACLGGGQDRFHPRRAPAGNRRLALRREGRHGPLGSWSWRTALSVRIPCP